jgi:hypothetical protein
VRLEGLPCALAEFVDGQGIRVDVDAFHQQKRVMSDLVEHLTMLRQRCQDQRQG